MSSVRLYCKKVGVGIPIGLIQRLTRTAVPVLVQLGQSYTDPKYPSYLSTVRVRLYTEDRGQRTQDTEAKAAIAGDPRQFANSSYSCMPATLVPRRQERAG
jgi:hypothetical protein